MPERKSTFAIELLRGSFMVACSEIGYRLLEDFHADAGTFATTCTPDAFALKLLREESRTL